MIFRGIEYSDPDKMAKAVVVRWIRQLMILHGLPMTRRAMCELIAELEWSPPPEIPDGLTEKRLHDAFVSLREHLSRVINPPLRLDLCVKPR